LVKESEGADALPLLAFTLKQLLADNRSGVEAHLTTEQYHASGGIAGALQKRLRAAQIATGATDRDLRRLFLPMLTTWDAEATPPAAKRLVAREADLFSGDRAPLRPLADALVEERLLTRSGGGSPGTTLDVAHEALLRQPPLDAWLDEDREFLIWRERLGRARAGYEAHERGLLADRELDIARTWLGARTEGDISAADRAFISSSIDAEIKRTRDMVRSKRRMRNLRIALFLLLLAWPAFEVLDEFGVFTSEQIRRPEQRTFVASERPRPGAILFSASQRNLDDTSGSNGRRCKSDLIKATSDAKWFDARAVQSAHARWREEVLSAYGFDWSDISLARDYRFACYPTYSSFFFRRCTVSGVPCRAWGDIH
jgi:hypothetical protein